MGRRGKAITGAAPSSPPVAAAAGLPSGFRAVAVAMPFCRSSRSCLCGGKRTPIKVGLRHALIGHISVLRYQITYEVIAAHIGPTSFALSKHQISR